MLEFAKEAIENSPNIREALLSLLKSFGYKITDLRDFEIMSSEWITIINMEYSTKTNKEIK